MEAPSVLLYSHVRSRRGDVTYSVNAAPTTGGVMLSDMNTVSGSVSAASVAVVSVLTVEPENMKRCCALLTSSFSAWYTTVRPSRSARKRA